MTRKPFRFWLISLLLGPTCALALDIGEIQVHSALNQLFDARIPLPALAPEELGKVSVRLAPAAMYKEFQLERAAALTHLVFSIEYNAEGQVYVKVISTKPIQEPSLGLLVEFGWPRGKTFREFTVFLDPVQRLAHRPSDRSKTVLNAPTAAPAPPVAPEPRPESPPATVAATPEPEPGAQPDSDRGSESKPTTPTVMAEAIQAPEQPPLPVEAPTPAQVYRPNDTYGPVAAGEGLWGIALKVRPDPGITREEMTQALFQANPHAFGKAGISGLKAGATLRIPSFQEIAEITGSTAARHLAGLEQPAAAVVPPPSPAPAATPTPTPTVAPTIPEVFPLEPPAPLEPIVVEAAPPVPAPETMPPIPTPESATSPSEPVAVESESIPAVYELATIIPMPLALFEPMAVVSLPPAPPLETPLQATQPLSAPEPATPPSEPVALEATQPLSAPEPATPPSEPVAVESESVPAGSELVTIIPEPLAPLEPIAVAALPPALPPEASPPISTPEPATPPSEPVAIESEFAPADPVPSATTSEPAGSTTAPVMAVESESVAQPGVGVEEPMPIAPELVSVTPLLFLAVSEMVAAIAQPPAAPVLESATTRSEPKAPAMPEPPVAAAAAETPPPASTTMPEPSAMPMDTTNLLAVVEKYLPHMNQDSLLQTYLASDVSIPTTTPFAESPPDPALTADAITPPAAEVEEVSAPTVSAAPQRLAADPLESPPKADEPPVRSYQVGAQYGPVAPNERLWDIAAKVRPDPGISKPHMMKALLEANPQAFSKPGNMDSLKVGATLRIPTLREIVEYTDSKAARQLLEQQEIAETSSPSAPEPEPVAETPSMLEPLASEPAAETPPVSEPTESEPAPDSETLPVGETSPAN